MRLLPTWKSTPLQDLAKGLATELHTRYPNYPKILLVCHSLGGLVAKRYIIDSIKRDQPLRAREVIFFATRHFGALLANWGGALSFKHRHLRQVAKESDFIEQINEDWTHFKCEAAVGPTYVVGGQDACVSRHSAGAGLGAKVELIPDKGHIDVVKPTKKDDIAFLLLKKAALRLLSDRRSDLAALKSAIEKKNSTEVAALIVNRGRTWIETEEAPEAQNLFKDVERIFDADSIEVIWSQYLSSITDLFRERAAPANAFDQSMLDRADRHGLRPLILAERMEFARRRRDPTTLSLLSNLDTEIAHIKIGGDQTNAYALGVAFFLIGNLLRAGGRYSEASEKIAKGKSFFRSSIPSHQIELAHCHYALTVCRAMTGTLFSEPLPPGLRLDRFVDALSTLTFSHSAWATDRLGEASEQAERAALVFQQIQFGAYAKRAETLSALLTAWRRLELGAPTDESCDKAGEDGPRIRGLLGNSFDNISELRAWIPQARPSRVLGILQFASAFNPDWSKNIGKFELPPVLTMGSSGWQWVPQSCTSLAEADSALRSLMGIAQDIRVPLLAD